MYVYLTYTHEICRQYTRASTTYTFYTDKLCTTSTVSFYTYLPYILRVVKAAACGALLAIWLNLEDCNVAFCF